MLGRNAVPVFGQTSILFHGSGIQNHDGHIQAGRDIFINSPVPQACENQDDARRKEVLNSLKFEQMGTRQQNIKRAHAQTCQWFFDTQEYKTWLDLKKSRDHGGFLWIKGKPGVGKSTLMKLALDHTCRAMHSPESCILSFFFNSRGSDLEKSTAGLYRALLVQLLKAHPESQHVLDHVEEGHQWGIELLKQTFERVLQELDDQYQLVCFIDGLDECQEQEIRELITWLSELSCEYQLHICLASRHFPNIAIRKGLQIILENRQEHTQDICSYIRDRLYFKDERRLATQIRVELQTKASGIFMWVVLVIDMLHREYDAGQKHKILEKVRELPDDLHELFRDIFTRGSALDEGLLLCLQWLLFSKYPLSPRQLYFAIISGTEPQYLVRCHAQDISDSDIERYILNTSRGLVEITKSWRSSVQFIHESIKDFLLKEDGLGTLWQDLKTNVEGHSQDSLKRCCSRYQTAIYALLHQTVSSALARRLLPEIVEHRKVLNRKYPFLEYANDGVLYHANQAEEYNINQNAFLRRFSTEIWSKLQDIFDTRGTRWYWPNVSLLYVLTAKNYSALIQASSLRTCFDVEDGPYGAPIFVALAIKSFAALESLLAVFLQEQAEGDMSCHDQTWSVRLDYDKVTQTSRMKDFAFSPGKSVVSYLAEFGCSGILKICLDFHSTGMFHIQRTDGDGWTPLSYAARNGDVATIRLLIEYDAPVDASTMKGWTPLLLAVLKGHLNAAELLIDEGANIDAKTVDGFTPLYLAAKKGYSELAKLLVAEDAQVETSTHDGKTPLYWARMNDLRDLAILLMDHGATLDEVEVYGRARSDERAILHSGLADDERERIMNILEGAPGAYDQSYEGSTSLSSCSFSGRTEIVMLLLDRGIDVNSISVDNKTPLHITASQGHTETARLLLDRGANINAACVFGQMPLHAAAEYGHTDIAELLLDRGANIDATSIPGHTSLHAAAAYGRTETAKLLLDRGANIHAIDTSGKIPLYAAAEYGHTEIAKLLLDRGANINAINASGKIPLHAAAEYGHTEIARLLLDRGANVNAKTTTGETPLHKIVQRKSIRMARLLLERGADSNAKSSEGTTPFRAASLLENKEMMVLLRSYGANSTSATSDHEAESVCKSNRTFHDDAQPTLGSKRALDDDTQPDRGSKRRVLRFNSG